MIAGIVWAPPFASRVRSWKSLQRIRQQNIRVTLVQQGVWDMPLDWMPLAAGYLKAMVLGDNTLRARVRDDICNIRGSVTHANRARPLFESGVPDVSISSVVGNDEGELTFRGPMITWRDASCGLHLDADRLNIDDLDILPFPFSVDAIALTAADRRFRYDVALFETIRRCLYKLMGNVTSLGVSQRVASLIIAGLINRSSRDLHLEINSLDGPRV